MVAWEEAGRCLDEGRPCGSESQGDDDDDDDDDVCCCAAVVCAIVQSSIRLWKYVLFFGSNDFGVTLLRLYSLSISSFLVFLMGFLELLQAGMVRRDKVGVEREREREEAANKAESERQHEMLERRKADEAREVAMEEVRSRPRLNPVFDMRLYTI